MPRGVKAKVSEVKAKIKEEKAKGSEKKHNGGGGAAAGGVIWFIGWLFTWSFASLVWWKILVGIIAWPYFLGEAVKHIVS